MRRIDLDHNATTPMEPEVLAVMTDALSDVSGNPSSLHAAGRRARDAVESARASVARLLGASPEEILFTSGGTEANNLALIGTMDRSRGALVVSSVEHVSVLAPAAALETRGVTVRRVDPGPSGAVSASTVLDRVAGDETVLVSLMLANNETGVIQPVREVARGVDPSRILLHTDAVQAIGKIRVDVNDLGVSFLTLTAHKIGGPKGVGALWAKRGAFPNAILHGGGQEWGMRPGTENVAAIVGFGAAAGLALARLAREAPSPDGRAGNAAAGLAVLRDRFEAQVLARVSGAVRIGADAARIPNTSCLAFPGIEGVTLVELLDLKGVAASTGSACEAGSSDTSHVLRAMRVPDDVARGAVRFSLGWRAAEDDVLDAADRIAEAVEDLSGR
jgi:cysteine desulfurase